MKQNITPEEVVNFLNELLNIDSVAINTLFNIRTYCNKYLAEHSTVQVGADGSVYQVGIIGVLNGMFGTYPNGWGCIAYELDNGRIVKFSFLGEDEAKNEEIK